MLAISSVQQGRKDRPVRQGLQAPQDFLVQLDPLESLVPLVQRVSPEAKAQQGCKEQQALLVSQEPLVLKAFQGLRGFKGQPDRLALQGQQVLKAALEQSVQRVQQASLASQVQPELQVPKV